MKEEGSILLHRGTCLCKGLDESRCIIGSERLVQLDRGVQTRSAKRGSQKQKLGPGTF